MTEKRKKKRPRHSVTGVSAGSEILVVGVVCSTWLGSLDVGRRSYSIFAISLTGVLTRFEASSLLLAVGSPPVVLAVTSLDFFDFLLAR